MRVVEVILAVRILSMDVLDDGGVSENVPAPPGRPARVAVRAVLPVFRSLQDLCRGDGFQGQLAVQVRQVHDIQVVVESSRAVIANGSTGG